MPPSAPPPLPLVSLWLIMRRAGPAGAHGGAARLVSHFPQLKFSAGHFGALLKSCEPNAMRLDARVLARQARARRGGEIRERGSSGRQGEEGRMLGWGMGSSSWQDIIFAPNESQQFRISLSRSLSRLVVVVGRRRFRLSFALFIILSLLLLAF